MKIEQIYTGCLAQGAYYIESNKEVAIIDPLRETKPYLERAEKNGAKIKYIFETHFHADFVSGHVDLAEKTGAKIVYGPTAKTDFEAHVAEDKEVFHLGDVRIKALHTPGHTLESTTYLLIDEEGRNHAIFTGDTLFLGDVGRPDLAVKSDLSQEDLAGLLFDSLRQKIMPLEDSLIVYPGHGQGSACGKHMSKDTVDTLGSQKRSNYALRPDMSREEFVKEVTEGLLPPPQYFVKNVMMNKQGSESLDSILKRGKVALNVEDFERIALQEHALILDTRHQSDFVKDFIPRSIFIGIDGGFAPWVGALIDNLEQPILIVADQGREEEVITRLSRVGYDNTLGYLEGGIGAWKTAGRPTETLNSISATQLYEHYKNNKVEEVLDVRRQGEYDKGHVEDATHLPLDYINTNMSKIQRDKSYHIHCAGGYRSVIAASILKARGYKKVFNIEGGYKAIVETEIPKQELVS